MALWAERASDGAETTDLRGSPAWRVAVRGLQIAGLGMFLAVVGLVTSVWVTGVGFTVVAVGVGIYLVGAVAIYFGIIPAIRALPKPRPSFWRLRRLLMRDALHGLG